MPIGVQVIGKPFQDELVLRIMNELEDSHKEEALQMPNVVRFLKLHTNERAADIPILKQEYLQDENPEANLP